MTIHSKPNFSRYALSCGLLLVPVIAWNLAFTSKLMPPSVMSEFWRDVPAPLVLIENLLRALVIVVPFAMPLRIATKYDRRALIVFSFGTFGYFSSWLALIYLPKSSWSLSIFGSLAPAYTPILWLTGIAMLGNRLFWGQFYRWWMYLILCVGFLAAHITHVLLVYFRSS